MARSGIEKNRKFQKLGQRLNACASGMGEALALGLLETLWNAAYERADEYLGDAEDVEVAAGWRGIVGELTAYLVDVGFIEKSERGGFQVHDFWEHAPPWVKRKAVAAAKRAEAGQTISDVRKAAGKKGYAALIETATNTPQPTDAGQKSDQLLAKTLYRDGTGRDGTGSLSEGKAADFTRGQFETLWLTLRGQVPSGDHTQTEEAARKIGVLAALRKVAPESLACSMFVAFDAELAAWSVDARGRTVEKFVKHFDAVQDRMDGKVKGAASGETQRQVAAMLRGAGE